MEYIVLLAASFLVVIFFVGIYRVGYWRGYSDACKRAVDSMGSLGEKGDE